MKKTFDLWVYPHPTLKKLIMELKIALFIVLFSVTNVFATNTYSQVAKVTLDMENKTLEQVMDEIESQSEFYFIFNQKQIDVNRFVDIQAENKLITDILPELFKGTNVNYAILDRKILLTTDPLENNLLAISSGTEPQQNRITGTVTEKDGTPLPGVNVVVTGTTLGAMTDIDGKYSIEIPQGARSLTFSFVGMVPQEITIGTLTQINVTMAESAIGLEEVVVIGYGTQKKLELTSAVSSVKSEDFVKGSIIDAAQLIKGQVAGVSIINPDADPTGTSQILLRGVTTLASGTQPLIVIDGVPGGLNDVAPEDIESIDILKDGSAAAIYGTRGTNGVILITTKKVKEETPAMVEWNSYISAQIISKTLDFMNADEYRALVVQGKPGAVDYGSNTNWIDKIFRTPLSQTHNVSMKSGNENSNYIININYKALQGLLLKSDNNILNVRIEANHTMFNGKVKINGNIIGYDQKSNKLSNERNMAYSAALIYNPTDVVKDADGNWTEHPQMMEWYRNPVSLIKEVSGVDKSTNLRSFGSITVFPLKGLTFKVLGSHEIYSDLSGYSESFKHWYSIVQARKGYAERSTSRSVEDLIETTANYLKSFNKHNVTLLGGYSYNKTTSENFYANNFNFPSDIYSYNNLSDGTARTAGLAGMDSYKESSKLVSYFARGNYNYNEKYILMASIRYEGSSKFGENHKWAAFPAVSIGWNIIREPFMKNVAVVSALKIRGGYGITGTAPSSSYQSLSRLSYGDKFQYNGQWIPVIYPSSNANPNLRWEKKKEINLGLELGVFNDRIFGTVDFYKRTTKDLLWDYSVATPPYLYNSVFANAGTIENKGIEVQITGIPVQTSALKWNTTITYSINSNKLVSLSSDEFQLKSGFFYTGHTGAPIQTTTHRIKEGEAIGNFWGYKSIDIDDNGLWIIEGEDGNPKSIKEQQPTDKKVLGNGLPKYYLSWNNSIYYKQFDLNLTMRGAFDYQILNFTRMYYGVPINLSAGNVLANTYDNIYGKRPLSDFQEQQYVSYFIEDGDYWKIDNITLGYILDFKKGYIKYLRLYASGSNMFTFTGYSGIDPEVNSIGLYPGNDDRFRYPSARTYTFGISVKF